MATAPSYIVCHCQEEFGSDIFLIALEVGVGAVRLPLSLLFARLNKSSFLSPPQPLLAGYEPYGCLFWTLSSFSIALNQGSKRLLHHLGMTTARLSRGEQ